MDWRALIRNKWFLGAAGVVAVVGGVVLYRRSKSGASSTGSTSTTAGTTTAAQGSFDTTGTDLNAALANFSSSLSGTLAGYQQSLTDAITQLQGVPVGDGGTGTGNTGTTGGTYTGGDTVHQPTPAPPPAYVTVAKYTSSNTAWNSTLSGIASHYGTTVSNLLTLNPQIKDPNLIITGSQIRVK
ncbi:MAG TPA: LysM domain-containing protein [Rugosimonospora sp.]|nr:LysM domain-containing protein [Rugosimonospora sp.]